MDATAILIVGGVVGTIAKFLVGAGVRGVWASIMTVIVSIVTTGLWAFSKNNLTRETSFEYFAGLASVVLIAAGAFHVIENAPSAMKGTGDGTVKPGNDGGPGTGLIAGLLLALVWTSSSCAPALVTQTGAPVDRYAHFNQVPAPEELQAIGKASLTEHQRTRGCWWNFTLDDGLAEIRCPAPFSPYGVTWVRHCVDPTRPEVVIRKADRMEIGCQAAASKRLDDPQQGDQR